MHRFKHSGSARWSMMTHCQGLHARVGKTGIGNCFFLGATANHMHIMPLQTFGIIVLQANHMHIVLLQALGIILLQFEGWLRLQIRHVQFWVGEVEGWGFYSFFLFAMYIQNICATTVNQYDIRTTIYFQYLFCQSWSRLVIVYITSYMCHDEILALFHYTFSALVHNVSVQFKSSRPS